MAFMKYAYARVVQPNVTKTEWRNVRIASKKKVAETHGDLSENLIQRASDFLGVEFNPNKYLLTHATIIASVDTFSPPGMKTGSLTVDGFKVNRKYSNFRIKAKSDQYINNNCFAPGTPITMADGSVKPIGDVCIGDMVLTHKGRARKVLDTFRHDVDTNLVEVKVRASNERVFVTSEHPFFAFPSVKACVECGAVISRKVLAISHLLGKHYCSKECYYKRRVSNADLMLHKTGQFIPIGELTTQDFAAMPVVDGENPVAMTLKQARLLGLFVAEGYYEQDSDRDNMRVGVCWAFHENEQHTLAQDVLNMMMSEFGVSCVIREHSQDHGITVTTKVCSEAVSFFSSYVKGAGSKSKVLESTILTAPRAIQAEILRGWFDGDGSAFDTGADFRMVGVTASQSLANQMRILLHRQGIAPQMQHVVSEGRRRLKNAEGGVSVVSDPDKECHAWQVTCGGSYLEDLVQTTRHEDAYNVAMACRTSYQKAPELRFLNGYCLQMITGLDPVAYCGPVFNFETEEDHSYIAGGIAVHNCDAWDRPVLLKAYRTFIGGHNFVEHVQVEELSKGRIIDAVARDIGDSIYVDILIATDRKHKDLVKSIESGKMGTLSMGCFLPGTQVSLGDGRRIAIEDVQPGDMVLTHKGRAREVVNKQVRGGKWDMRTVHAVGLASPVTSTANHPYYVLRPVEVCACGCGDALPTYASSVQKQTTRSMTRRFKVGHDKRILNPNNTYSMDEFKRRKAQMGAIQSPELVKVRADELRVGDFVAFPRVKDGEHTVATTNGKAQLLGYFLSEGSFLKHKGKHCEVQFNFSMDEKDTFVAEVTQLLRQEFPKASPWVQERPDRTTCTVHVTGVDLVAWFLQHGGEYSHGKCLSAEAMNWSEENHKHLIGTWLNGDGHRAKAHGGFLVGTTVSLDLASQMHTLMAKCGWFARFEARIGAKSVTVAEAINGGVAVRDEATGKLPAYLLTIGNTQSVELHGYCAKAPTMAKYGTQNNRIFDDWVASPITAIEESTYEGDVHNMEVAEDHTYIAEGASVGNCTVDGTICTKCGNWAADETEMCFPSGTRVLKSDGKYVPIEEIVQGDLVLTHKGNYRPVMNTMARQHDGHVTVMDIEGVPNEIRATTTHPFWVLRPSTHCACGCGQPLRHTIEHERGATKAFQRRFLPGHNSRVFNPNPDTKTNLLTLADYQKTFEVNFEFVPAKDIRKGDYLSFPIPQETVNTSDATEAKARLIGYFLAEGSFIKRDGKRVGITFTFGSHEYATLAAEVEKLLQDEWGGLDRRQVTMDWRTEVASKNLLPIRRRSTSPEVPEGLTCPTCLAPSNYARPTPSKTHKDRYRCKVCDRSWIASGARNLRTHRFISGSSTEVRFMWQDAAEWFFRYCGEYAEGKELHADVMHWAPEIQKHVMFGWMGGDGAQCGTNIIGTTVSFHLMGQMHVIAARCGWHSRKNILFNAKAATFDQVVNGQGVAITRDSRGWLPSFALNVTEPVGFGSEVRFDDPEKARVTMPSVTDAFKRVGNWILYRVRDVHTECFSGVVHNIEVADDNSYVVDGLAVHNCGHIKYAKGNSFFDEEGKQNRIAELCGHESIGDTGGVQFIEASWVETPAFTGAVLRNVLDFDAETVKKAKKVLASPPPEWSSDSMVRAASSDFDAILTKKFSTPAQQNILVEASADDMFLAGWMDEGSDEGGDESGGDATPADPTPPAVPAAQPKAPFQDVEDDAYNQIKDRIRDRFKKDLAPAESPTPVSTNETLNKQAAFARKAYVAGLNDIVRTASCDASLIDRVAAFNRQVGIIIPIELYRASLKVGSTDRHSNVKSFTRACHQVLGHKPTPSETRTLVRLGQLLFRRKAMESR